LAFFNIAAAESMFLGHVDAVTVFLYHAIAAFGPVLWRSFNKARAFWLSAEQ
jgi:hypothetical protein